MSILPLFSHKVLLCLCSIMSETNYTYIIHTREFISLNLSVYKIGKTKQELTSSGRNKRCSEYPKGSIQIEKM